ncbi:MAG: 2-oxoacid:acceptor oxidoreductase subunit alpha [Candidatus Sumerlaeia bacterium]
MTEHSDVLTGAHFMNGDEACAEGALAAGCRFFAGYPITPATEIAETMADRMGEVGGVFIQMEDELASMNAIIGASWGGVKSMTATSGPGFSLMMENLGLALMTETPCVVVNVQRGGPSTGLPTLVGQQDMMQARWGSHGDYEIIALTPNSPQEMFDLTLEAFNLSERFRLPVLVMADEVVGHMTEKVVIPAREELKIVNRKKWQKSDDKHLPYRADEDLVPPMAAMGEGSFQHITGLTHDERGYPGANAAVQDALVRRLIDKVRKYAKTELTRYEAVEMDDAEVVIVCYGITSRSCLRAVRVARERGIKAGMIRLQIVWPFPDHLIEEIAAKARAIIVPEINMGQIVREVQRAAGGKCPVHGMPIPGGAMHKPEQIVEMITREMQ